MNTDLKIDRSRALEFLIQKFSAKQRLASGKAEEVEQQLREKRGVLAELRASAARLSESAQGNAAHLGRASAEMLAAHCRFSNACLLASKIVGKNAQQQEALIAQLDTDRALLQREEAKAKLRRDKVASELQRSIVLKARALETLEMNDLEEQRGALLALGGL